MSVLHIEPNEVTSLRFSRDEGFLYVSTSDGGVFIYKNVLDVEYRLLCAGGLSLITEFLKSRPSPIVALKPVLSFGG